MARYPLIIRDATYLELLKICGYKGKTMGKMLNIIIEEYVERNRHDGHVPVQAICFVCGRKATIEAHGRGQQKLFVCPDHLDLARKAGSYRHLKKKKAK